jgi:hypothetical protein
MTEKKQRKPWDPDDYLTYGLLGIFVGGLVLGATYEDAPIVGFIILGIAGLFLQIGIIAKGVEVGNKSSFVDDV